MNTEAAKVYCISLFGTLAMNISVLHESFQVIIGAATATYTALKAYREYKKYKKEKNETAK